MIQGQDIRPRGQECRSGDRLLPAGSLVTPAALGLAAAAGYDELLTVPRPSVEVLVLGDELLAKGLPHDGLIRDALGPMLAPWLRTLGADVIATRRIGDSAEALRRAVAKSTADLVITTGGTAGGRSTMSTRSCGRWAPNCWWTASPYARAIPCCWPGWSRGGTWWGCRATRSPRSPVC